MPKKDQGVSNNRFQIIPRTLIFITQGNRLLLIKGHPQKRIWANLYNGIGGHIERGEDVLSAARRELKEETGLEIDHLWLCGIVMIDAGEETGIGLFVFRGETDQQPVENSAEGSLEWIALEKLREYPLVEDLPVLLPKVLSAKRNGELFYARYWYDENDHLRIDFSN
ncbi:ADP-ribose pyrophosphatase [Bellilinea caldifistulae]|uniref:NUDIX hydrolase n=1 Tax=Bellilinea caldifistulae TaxID=360411 RepID=UPI000784A7B4|nr:NUDIX domain-containing protein [Bellilinea caldifistulae]GAP10720.1 ADP-ribose pyrophosphatase [Bellilinea caldifistulae]